MPSAVPGDIVGQLAARCEYPAIDGGAEGCFG
jgi:hypothetical protein